MASLPFTLEDQLLKDVEAYHFVPLGKTRGGQDVPVAVIEHEYVSGVLNELQGHGWRVKILVPDYLAITSPLPGVWLLDAADAPFLLRMPGDEGGATLFGKLNPQPPGPLLLALEQVSPAPQTLRVRVGTYNQSEQVAAWSSQLQPYNIELDVYEDNLSRSAWLTRQGLPGVGVNLLTGTYTPVGEERLWSRRLLPAAGLAAMLAVVTLTHWIIEGAQLQSEHRDLQQSIATTYRQVFPEARNLVDPRYQLEQQIKILSDQQEDTGGFDFLPQLSQLAPYFGEGQDYRLQTINYDGSSITLEVSVADYEALQRLQEQLARGATINVENAELRDGRVYGRIIVRRQA